MQTTIKLDEEEMKEAIGLWVRSRGYHPVTTAEITIEGENTVTAEIDVETQEPRRRRVRKAGT